MSAATPLETPSPTDEIRQGGVSTRVGEALEKGIQDGILRGGVVLAAQRGHLTTQVLRGGKLSLRGEVPAEPLSFETVFDLGTLTEVVCTATLMMRFVSAGKISALDRASRYLQSLGVGQKSHITLAHLLAHCAGFPAAVGIYDELVRANNGPRPGILASSGARQYAYSCVRKVPVKFEPGTRQLRSDIDYLLLGEICEIITGMPLEKAFSRFIAEPLKLRSLNFVDLSLVRSKNYAPVEELFNPTGECPRRQQVMCGQVWDETAWVMGGVAGHNGLFGTARDLLMWALEVLAAMKGESNLIGSDAARMFLLPGIKDFEPSWRLGFDVLPIEGREVGREVLVASSATGCSVVIDPWRDKVAVVLLSSGMTGSGARRLASTRGEVFAALVETE